MVTISLDEQRRIVRSWATQGALRTYALLNRRQDELIDLAIARLSMGFDLYGDVMFHQSFDELERETWEELADAINRQAVYSWHES